MQKYTLVIKDRFYSKPKVYREIELGEKSAASIASRLWSRFNLSCVALIGRDGGRSGKELRVVFKREARCKHREIQWMMEDREGKVMLVPRCEDCGEIVRPRLLDSCVRCGGLIWGEERDCGCRLEEK